MVERVVRSRKAEDRDRAPGSDPSHQVSRPVIWFNEKQRWLRAHSKLQAMLECAGRMPSQNSEADIRWKTSQSKLDQSMQQGHRWLSRPSFPLLQAIESDEITRRWNNKSRDELWFAERHIPVLERCIRATRSSWCRWKVRNWGEQASHNLPWQAVLTVLSHVLL